MLGRSIDVPPTERLPVPSKSLPIALLLLALPLVALAEPLKLDISGVETGEDGELIVCLFHNGEHWLDMTNAFGCKILAPDTERVTVEFDVPPEGHFAAQVLHDTNGDGKPNFKIFPPRFLEGFAFSNGYKPRMKPSYKKAQFVPTTNAVELEMTY